MDAIYLLQLVKGPWNGSAHRGIIPNVCAWGKRLRGGNRDGLIIDGNGWQGVLIQPPVSRSMAK